jgi:hypothetical protein
VLPDAWSWKTWIAIVFIPVGAAAVRGISIQVMVSIRCSAWADKKKKFEIHKQKNFADWHFGLVATAIDPG